MSAPGPPRSRRIPVALEIESDPAKVVEDLEKAVWYLWREIENRKKAG
jgi:hypothetical protein